MLGSCSTIEASVLAIVNVCQELSLFNKISNRHVFMHIRGCIEIILVIFVICIVSFTVMLMKKVILFSMNLVECVLLYY